MLKRPFALCLLPFVFCLSLTAQPAYTLISDTLPPAANGQLVNGTVNVQNTQFTYGVYTVAQSALNGVNYPIVNGNVSIQLAATDHATVPVTYTVTSTFGGKAVTTYWSIPTLPSPACQNAVFCRINEVTVGFPAGPSLLVNPSQISTGQSSLGQYMCNERSIAAWCNLPPSALVAPSLAPNTAVFLDSAGLLDSVIGQPNDCVTQSGGTVPCESWGDIAGTLSDQTDLAAALSMKLTAANNLSDVGSAATARTNLGLGSAAVESAGAFLQGGNNLSDLANFAVARANLGLGSAAQMSSSDFQAVINKNQPNGYAGLDTNGNLVQNTSGTAVALATVPSQCGTGQASSGIAANGNANCFSLPGGGNNSSSGYSQTFSSVTSVAITHNFNTLAVSFTCWDNSSPRQWILPKSASPTDANTLTVTFASAQSGMCVVVF